MLGKVKKWLGIEGVKLELRLVGDFNVNMGAVAGAVVLTSLEPQTVTSIRIHVIEKYARGRDDEQLVDEYELGRTVIDETTEVPGGGTPVEVPFRLAFAPVRSPVEEFGNRNPLFGGLAWAARKLRNASSEYRIEAEAQVRGVGLNPFDKRVLS